MIIIQGSSRNDGHSAMISKFIRDQNEQIEIIDLSNYSINDFSYNGRQQDDFLVLIERILLHQTFIWITPVYWYTMSGTMKRFLDRFSDLLKWDKPIGRKLRGKSMLVISNSGSDDAPMHFQDPFELSAEYLGINYLGYEHTWIEDGVIAEESIKRINNLLGRIG